jgi:hypothetical protein
MICTIRLNETKPLNNSLLNNIMNTLINRVSKKE